MVFRSPNQQAVTPQGRGRFPGYDVLGEVRRWDSLTAGVVLARLMPASTLAFFTPEENAIAGPLCDLLLAQDCEPRIPVVAMIDIRLARGESDGWHYDDLPEDAQAWRDTLHALDEDARADGGLPFAQLDADRQAGLIQSVQDAGSADQEWHGWQAKHVWSLWTRYACTAFYSHPWAWNEIGYGGPAYPRGYKNTHAGGRERWEVADHADTDPVPFSARIERARETQARRVRQRGAGA